MPDVLNTIIRGAASDPDVDPPQDDCLCLLKNALAPNVTVQGVGPDDFFPVGTPLEQILIEMLVVNSLSGLGFSGQVGFVEVGSTVTATQYYWNVKGTAIGLVLTDNNPAGALNASVTGESYTPPTPVTYNLSVRGTIIVRLTSANLGSLSISVEWMFKTFYGSRSEDITPIGEEIEVASGSLTRTSSFTANFVNGNVEYHWIAVHKAQTGKIYTKWDVDVLNNGAIGDGNLFVYKGTVVLTNGETYDVYMTDYATEFSASVKFS